MTIKMTASEFESMSAASAGVCITCNATQQKMVEPDATGYECDACGAMTVSGVQFALIRDEIEIVLLQAELIAQKGMDAAVRGTRSTVRLLRSRIRSLSLQVQRP